MEALDKYSVLPETLMCHAVLCWAVQALASLLLLSPVAAVAFKVLDTLKEMLRVPETYSSDNQTYFERPLCLALLKNCVIIDPLLIFCVTFAADYPSSDIEWLAIVGADFMSRVFGSWRRDVVVEVMPGWPDKR